MNEIKSRPYMRQVCQYFTLNYFILLNIFMAKLLWCKLSPYMVFNGFSESTLLYILLIAAKKCPVIEAIRIRQTHV